MTRLERRNRTDIEILTQGSIFDEFDNAVKMGWRINDDEYDFINDLEEDKYLDALIMDKIKSYSSAKEAIRLINEVLELYYNDSRTRTA